MLDNIVRPQQYDTIVGRVFDGLGFKGERQAIKIDDEGRIGRGASYRSKKKKVLDLPDDVLILPGHIDLHAHGRDCYDVLPGEEGDQTYKEDSYTLSLAMAQGGATRAMCMPNVKRRICTSDEYHRQMAWINTAQPHRKAPIMPLEMYVLIMGDTMPIDESVMYKMMWNTFGPANLKSDDDVPHVLSRYRTKWVTAHCETIAGMVSAPGLAHHEQRPKQAAIDAVRLFLKCAKEHEFHAHVAHISSAEEVDLVTAYSMEPGAHVSCEVTPQSLLLNHDEFERETGLPLKFGQQNPPIRSRDDMMALRDRVHKHTVDVYATDHAPHVVAEKEKGMSGMTQAPTAGQALLELVEKKVITLEDAIDMGCTVPGTIMRDRLGVKAGAILPGYEASFTLATLGKQSRIQHKDVLSKCGWTPYNNLTWSNTIEGVIVKGTLYTQAALQRLRTDT